MYEISSFVFKHLALAAEDFLDTYDPYMQILILDEMKSLFSEGLIRVNEKLSLIREGED